MEPAFGRVTVPTVYSKDMWAERRLTDVELADVLDLPGTLMKRLKPGQLAKVRAMGVPGKVIVALFESLDALVSENAERETATKGGAGEDGPKRKAETKDLRGVDGSKKLRASEEPGSSEGDGGLVGPNSIGIGGEKEPFHTVSDKATKSDDAPAPIHLFDGRVVDALNLGEEQRIKVCSALNVLRRFGLRLWKRNVRSSFTRWLKQQTTSEDVDHQAMKQAGWDVCRRVDGASCWDWDAGSALVFWRWPEAYQRES